MMRVIVMMVAKWLMIMMRLVVVVMRTIIDQKFCLWRVISVISVDSLNDQGWFPPQCVTTTRSLIQLIIAAINQHHRLPGVVWKLENNP